jgi:hypothetical protein
MKIEKVNDYPVYYSVIPDGVDFEGIDIISLVNKPAVKRSFIALNEQKEIKLSNIDEEKRIITGVVLIPDEKIFRNIEGEKFYMAFSEDAIEKYAMLYLKQHNQFQVNKEHDKAIDDVYVFESWLVENPENDKANALGFDNLIKGMWFISMKVDNEETWDEVKENVVNGFSIQGFLSMKLEQKEIELSDNIGSEILDIINKGGENYDKILNKINTLITN